MPTPTCAMLSTEEYPGPHSFEIQIDGKSSGSKWMVSVTFKRLLSKL
jgi:hypothetical protein